MKNKKNSKVPLIISLGALLVYCQFTQMPITITLLVMATLSSTYAALFCKEK
jgi:uncharacterized membrane protein YraQ (UPF0718 family)